MKSIVVLISTILTLCSGMSVPSQKENVQSDKNNNQNEKYLTESSSTDSIISLLPLKILLEYKLKNDDELQRALSEQELQYKGRQQADIIKENSKSVPSIPKNENSQIGLCTEANLFKNLTSSEISRILNNDFNNNENLTKQQLQKIYNSLKDCFYVKAVNAKLWGPIWHCLNRLFLFFVLT